MASATPRASVLSLHPLHAILLAGSLPLFLGTLLSDWAYSSTYQVQWTNFASWLNAGALIFVGLALLWSIIDAFRADNRSSSKWLLVGLLAVTFVVGFINSLVHAKDAWAAMPMGLVLSAIVLVLALASIWAGFWSRPGGEERR